MKKPVLVPVNAVTENNTAPPQFYAILIALLLFSGSVMGQSPRSWIDGTDGDDPSRCTEQFYSWRFNPATIGESVRPFAPATSGPQAALLLTNNGCTIFPAVQFWNSAHRGTYWEMGHDDEEDVLGFYSSLSERNYGHFMGWNLKKGYLNLATEDRTYKAQLFIDNAAGDADGTNGIKIRNIDNEVIVNLEAGKNDESYVGTATNWNFSLRSNNTEALTVDPFLNTTLFGNLIFKGPSQHLITNEATTSPIDITMQPGSINGDFGSSLRLSGGDGPDVIGGKVLISGGSGSGIFAPVELQPAGGRVGINTGGSFGSLLLESLQFGNQWLFHSETENKFIGKNWYYSAADRVVDNTKNASRFIFWDNGDMSLDFAKNALLTGGLNEIDANKVKKITFSNEAKMGINGSFSNDAALTVYDNITQTASGPVVGNAAAIKLITSNTDQSAQVPTTISKTMAIKNENGFQVQYENAPLLSIQQGNNKLIHNTYNADLENVRSVKFLPLSAPLTGNEANLNGPSNEDLSIKTHGTGNSFLIGHNNVNNLKVASDGEVTVGNNLISTNPAPAGANGLNVEGKVKAGDDIETATTVKGNRLEALTDIEAQGNITAIQTVNAANVAATNAVSATDVNSTNMTATNVNTTFLTASSSVNASTITASSALTGQSLQVNNLAGSGNRMVIASSTGAISTQAIPSGGGGDNLGNHRATQNLDMNFQEINKVNKINFLTQGLSIRENGFNFNIGGSVVFNNLNASMPNDPSNYNFPGVGIAVHGNGFKTSAGSWLGLSDRRLKKDIKSFTGGLNIITKINPVTYKYNEYNEGTGKTDIGILAQELENTDIGPFTVVKTTPHDYLRNNGYPHDSVYLFNESGLIYALINSVKELSAQIDSLKAVQTLSEEKPRLTAENKRGLKLEQNRPNPFDAKTSVDYYIPADAKSPRLLVYSTAGQPVFETAIITTGFGTLDIELGHLPSGQYIYSLSAGNYKSVSKNMLLKK